MSLPATLAAALSSLLAVWLADRLFREQPATRRLFLIGLTVVTLVVPLVCVLLELRIIVGLLNVTLPSGLPGTRVALWPALMVPGAIWCGVYLARLAVVRRRLKALPLTEDPRLRGSTDELARKMRLPEGLPIALADAGPASTTLGGALIVLPPDAVDWDSTTRRAVLAHELVHVRRRDDLCLALVSAMARLFCWLPWVFRLPRLLERAIEESCDDEAARTLPSARTYLQVLYAVAKSRQRQGAPALVGLLGSDLIGRFGRFTGVRDQQIDSRGLYWAWLLLCLALGSIWSVDFQRVEPSAPEGRVVARTETLAEDGIVLRLREPRPAPLTALVTRSSGRAPAGTGPPG